MQQRLKENKNLLFKEATERDNGIDRQEKKHK